MPISAAFLDLFIGTMQRCDQSGGGHRTGDSHLSLATHLGAGDRGIALVEHADGTGREQKADDSLLAGAGLEALIEMQHSRHDARRPIGGRRNPPRPPAAFSSLTARAPGVDPSPWRPLRPEGTVPSVSVRCIFGARRRTLRTPGNTPGLTKPRAPRRPASPARWPAAAPRSGHPYAKCVHLPASARKFPVPCSRHNANNSCPEPKGIWRRRGVSLTFRIITANDEAAAQVSSNPPRPALPPATSRAVKRMPLVCRGSRSERMNNNCIGSSKRISCRPSSRSSPLSRIRRSVGSMLSGSTLRGSSPVRPSSTARSVPCPPPVSASEPYSRITTSPVFSSSPAAASRVVNSRAARIGPIVCEHGWTDADLEDIEGRDTHQICTRLSGGMVHLVTRLETKRRVEGVLIAQGQGSPRGVG